MREEVKNAIIDKLNGLYTKEEIIDSVKSMSSRLPKEDIKYLLEYDYTSECKCGKGWFEYVKEALESIK